MESGVFHGYQLPSPPIRPAPEPLRGSVSSLLPSEQTKKGDWKSGWDSQLVVFRCFYLLSFMKIQIQWDINACDFFPCFRLMDSSLSWHNVPLLKTRQPGQSPYVTIWWFPSMGVPNNGWFLIGKMPSRKGYPYFRKPPYVALRLSCLQFFSFKRPTRSSLLPGLI